MPIPVPIVANVAPSFHNAHNRRSSPASNRCHGRRIAIPPMSESMCCTHRLRSPFFSFSFSSNQLMLHAELRLKTRDGLCPTHVLHPEGMGPWPAVLVYMDGIGMRPAIVEIAERIANEGYYVLAPNLFYRVGYNAEYGVSVFEDPVTRADLMTRIMPSANAANIMSDTEAFLAHFDAQPNVRHGKI